MKIYKLLIPFLSACSSCTQISKDANQSAYKQIPGTSYVLEIKKRADPNETEEILNNKLDVLIVTSMRTDKDISSLCKEIDSFPYKKINEQDFLKLMGKYVLK